MKLLRAQHGISIAEMALRLRDHTGVDVKKGNVDDWERERLRPPHFVLGAYADIFRVSVSSLLAPKGRKAS